MDHLTGGWFAWSDRRPRLSACFKVLAARQRGANVTKLRLSCGKCIRPDEDEILLLPGSPGSPTRLGRPVLSFSSSAGCPPPPRDGAGGRPGSARPASARIATAWPQNDRLGRNKAATDWINASRLTHRGWESRRIADCGAEPSFSHFRPNFHLIMNKLRLAWP